MRAEPRDDTDRKILDPHSVSNKRLNPAAESRRKPQERSSTDLLPTGMYCIQWVGRRSLYMNTVCLLYQTRMHHGTNH